MAPPPMTRPASKNPIVRDFKWRILEDTKYLYGSKMLLLTSKDFTVRLSDNQKLSFSVNLKLTEKIPFWGRKSSVTGEALWIDWKSVPSGVKKVTLTLDQRQFCAQKPDPGVFTNFASSKKAEGVVWLTKEVKNQKLPSQVISFVLEIDFARSNDRCQHTRHSPRDLNSWSDFTITCRNVEFSCQKLNLALKSEIFKILFYRDAKEDNNLMNWDEYDPGTVKNFLDFLYFDSKNPRMTIKEAMDLLKMTDLYDLPRLKVFCEVVLANKIAMTNALSILHHARKFHSWNLEKEAKKYVRCNSFTLMVTKDFAELVKAYPDIFLEKN